MSPTPTAVQFPLEVLAEAGERARKYDWTGAADLYQKTTDGLHAEVAPEGVSELLARARFKAAFQAENRADFKVRMLIAKDLYERLGDAYRTAGLLGLESKAAARLSFANYWLSDDKSERRTTIDAAVSQGNKAAERLSEQGDEKELAESNRDLLEYLLEGEFSDYNWVSRKERFDKVLEVAPKAIEEFEELGDEYLESLAECLSIFIDFLAYLPYQVGEPARFPEFAAKAKSLLEKLVQVSQKADTEYTKCLAQKDLGTLVLLGMVEREHASGYASSLAAVASARSVKDSYLTGWASARAVIHAVWMGTKQENVEQGRRVLEEGIAVGFDGINRSSIPLEFGLLDWTHSFLADCHIALAEFVETDTEKKRALLHKAVEIARGAVIHGLPIDGHILSKALTRLASLETVKERRRQLLTEALRYREDAVRVNDQALGPQGRSRGVMRNYLAQVKIELAREETDLQSRLALLEGASSDVKQGLELISNWATTDFFVDTVSGIEELYGDILFELSRLSSLTHPVGAAIRLYEDSAAHKSRAGISPAAPVLWKLARAYDAFGDCEMASRTFKAAGSDYRAIAKRVPVSAKAMEGLALYMDAWSQIENARLHHNNERYSEAADNYAKAASMLEQTPDFAHLSTHYGACAELERGEASSRLEKPEDAVERFESAVRLFDETRLHLNRKLGLSPRPEERKELEEWSAVTLGRERYSGGRIKLEKARLLDKHGEKEASSTEYFSASEVFGSLAKAAPSEQSRRELETLRLFSEGWSKLKEAEVKAAPEIYGEASVLFLKTEKIAGKEKMQLLARGNASICRALASGTQFRRTRDTGIYSEIKKQLETAADYFQEGDFSNAAEWTRATARMFDALVYLADAESEKEPKKKTELFHLAEKHLELAAKLYGKAGFSRKREEAMKHLEKAREEKELLLTPLEALSETPSSYSSITPVSLVRDQSSGLERFEGPHVVGNIDLTQKDVGVGSDVSVELEMTNIGKTPAMLLKLENISPDGLELDRQKVSEKVAERVIDLRGRRLDYLKTHEIKIPLKANRKGIFELRPRVVFVDEKGNHGSHEFGPARVTVREMGIVGWVKGPR